MSETKQERYERLQLDEERERNAYLGQRLTEERERNAHLADLALSHRERPRPAPALRSPRKSSRPAASFSAKRALRPNDSLLLDSGMVLVHDRNYGSIELSMHNFAPPKKRRPLTERERELHLFLAEERVSRREKGY